MTTRTLHDLAIGDGIAIHKPVEQTAIPWCTTHDRSMTDEFVECDWSALQVEAGRFGGAGCVVSSGGPDHRWWQDIEDRRTP